MLFDDVINRNSVKNFLIQQKRLRKLVVTHDSENISLNQLETDQSKTSENKSCQNLR